jgi:hypothetical protein
MAFTRNQAKQQKLQQCVCSITPTKIFKNTNTNTNTNTIHSYNIDFIDASIEWRKNKIKRENCTFEYM